MVKFCAKCGATGVELEGSFCGNCRAGFVQAEIPSILKLKRCKKCNAVFVKAKWAEESPEIIKKAIEMKLRGKISDIDFLGNEAVFRIIAADQKGRTSIQFNEMICPLCERIMSKKYDIKIQVRPAAKTANPVKFERLVSFIKRQAHQCPAPEAASFWWEENRDGVDFFFGFRKVGEEVFQEAINRFRLSSVMSKEFRGFTRDQKKKVSTTYCLRV